MTVSILHERSEVADCLPLVRCATATGAGMAALHLSYVPARGRPMGTPLLRSDPFALSEVQPRHGGAEPSGAGVAALHLQLHVPARGRPMGSPLLCSDPFALSEVQP
jgi:hypothetical protein